MSVTTRTNRAVNPSVASAATNYSAVAGTGGTATGARNTGAGADETAGFYRTSWTVATTAVSGGVNYLQTGLSANTQYRVSAYVRSSKAQTIRLRAAWQNSSSSTVNTTNGTGVAVTANTWTRIDLLGTSGAAVDRVSLTAEATTGGSNWANGDTMDLDLILIEQTSILQDYFDGDYVDSLGIEYAWAGTAHASNSTAVTYVPTLTLLAKSDAPCDRVEITIADLPPTTQRVTLWKTVDGKRSSVRSYRKVLIVGSDFTTDYEVPLKRLVTYDLEVVSGTALGVENPTASLTISAPASGWIQDPLDPSTAVPLFGDYSTAGAYLFEDALGKIDYPADITKLRILGDSEPIALMSSRGAAEGLSFTMETDTTTMSANLRALLTNNPLLLIRPLPEWAPGLPGLCYTAAPTPSEIRVTPYGTPGKLVRWRFDTGLVKAPAMNVVIPVWTYTDFQGQWATYGAAQTALSGKTYLQVKKSPSGA